MGRIYILTVYINLVLGKDDTECRMDVFITRMNNKPNILISETNKKMGNISPKYTLLGDSHKLFEQLAIALLEFHAAIVKGAHITSRVFYAQLILFIKQKICAETLCWRYKEAWETWDHRKHISPKIY